MDAFVLIGALTGAVMPAPTGDVACRESRSRCHYSSLPLCRLPEGRSRKKVSEWAFGKRYALKGRRFLRRVVARDSIVANGGKLLS